MEFVSWDHDIPNCFWKVIQNPMVPNQQPDVDEWLISSNSSILLIPMVFPWFSHGFPMVFPMFQSPPSCPMVGACNTHSDPHLVAHSCSNSSPHKWRDQWRTATVHMARCSCAFKAFLFGFNQLLLDVIEFPGIDETS